MKKAASNTRELFYESEDSLLYIQDKGTKSPKIIKILRSESPDPAQILNFNNEFEYTNSIDIPGVRKAIHKEKENDKYTITLEYIPGPTLNDAFAKDSSIENFLATFSVIANTLGQIHDKGIIHKDLNGKNILIDERTNLPVIIDFGISARLDLRANNLGNPDKIRGTLSHMPPEQTGRVNRKVDSRSDLYSLGVTMFKTITGELPYKSDNSLEIVHFHIAKSIPSATAVNTKVPEIISKIIAKLLAKNAEDRYQSAYGLQHDLEKCLASYRDNGKIEEFALCEKDYSGRFEIPQKLFGREQEIELLLESFERASNGGTELFMVQGYSGVGKSSLIAEIYKPITEKRGYFASGKFDQYHRNTPYYAIFQAINEFCDILLTEHHETLEKWKNSIQKSLGDNGKVLTQHLPKLESIIGEQPDIPLLDAQENQNRFNVVFSSFIKTIAKKEHPFVLFCDDLQWADVVSLNLIKLLVSDTNNKYFMMIGAFRDNEVSAGHPLTIMLEDLKQDYNSMETITLGPLKEEHVQNIIEESFKLKKSAVQDLASLVYNKTQGNAFFTIEFLKTLYTEGFAKYDASINHWQIDFNSIQKKGITNNVVDLLVSKITDLPKNTQKTLKVASCIGSYFSLSILSVVVEKPEKEVLADLWPAVKEGFVTPSSDDYEYLDILQMEEGFVIYFQFEHDRIQQACYTLLNEDELSNTHLIAGHEFLKNLSSNPEKIFNVVDHLNYDTSRLNKKEKLKLSRHNLTAAVKSKNTGDYKSAQTYINMSGELSSDSIWNEDYSFALELYKTKAEISYLNGQFKFSQKTLEECLTKVTTPNDKSDIYFQITQNLGNQAMYQEAIQSARKALKQLDFNFPEKEDAEAQIPIEMGKIITYFTENGIDGIINLPDLKDEKLQATMRLLDNLSPNTYVAGETNLWILHVLYKVNLTIENGLSHEGGYAFTELGIIFNILNNNPSAYPSTKLGLKIAEKFKDISPRHHSRSGHLHINYNLAWNEHIKNTITMNPTYYQISLDCGEMIFAGYMSMYSIINRFFYGKESLEELKGMVPDVLTFGRRIKHALCYGSIEAVNLVFENLMGNTDGALSFDTDTHTEKHFLEEHTGIQNFYAIAILNLYKAQALYLQHEFHAALNSLQETEAFATVIAGNPSQDSIFRTIYPLTLLALLEIDPSKEEEYMPKIIAFSDQLKIWSENNPDNFEHKYLLIQAELHKYQQDDLKALDCYEKASKSAEKYEFERETALIQEKSGEYWLTKGNNMYAKAHLEQARYIYGKLGYNSLANKINSSHAHLFSFKSRANTHTITLNEGYANPNTTTLEGFDLLSIIKASQTLSEEIVMDNLLNKMLNIVIENAGGQRAVLILKDENSWIVEADKTIENGNTFKRSNLEDTTNIPVTIVNYVIRTKQDLASSDSSFQKIFDKDKYLVKKEIQSFLCMPLMHKGEIKGIIYVEHQTGANTFAEGQREVLKLLTSQMAVSIENASLYKKQQELNVAYQRFVPHNFIKSLGHKSILQVKLGDHIMADMTVMFCDIRSYSAMAENMTTEENFQFINEYLKRVGPLILKNNGFINHYFGDGFIALFRGKPDDAISAAIDINQELREYNKGRNSEGNKPIKVGFGLHKGPIMMGIIGDEDRHDANVLSDAVNASSRLEGLTKVFGANIILSEYTLKGIEDESKFHFRSLGKVKLVGKEDILTVYEMFDADAPEIKEKKVKTLDNFNLGMKNYYQQNFTEAAVSLKKVLTENPDDKTAKRFLQHAANFMVDGVPEDWDGVERMTAK